MNNKLTGIFSNHHSAAVTSAGSSLILLLCAACLPLLCFTTPAAAEVTWSGDLNPATDPTTWTSSTTAYIGKTSDGTMDITLGSTVISDNSYIGYSSGSTGVVTVDGPDSTWTSNGKLKIGGGDLNGGPGTGTLNITNGGTVSPTVGPGTSTKNYISFAHDEYGSAYGEVNVDGIGSTWVNNDGLVVGYGGGWGMLNITNGGAVIVHSNRDISTNFNLFIGNTRTSSITVDGPGSRLEGGYAIGVGMNGNGVLNITNGGVASSQNGYIYCTGSDSTYKAVATVDGIDSTWAVSGDSLYIGDRHTEYYGRGACECRRNAEQSQRWYRQYG